MAKKNKKKEQSGEAEVAEPSAATEVHERPLNTVLVNLYTGKTQNTKLLGQVLIEQPSKKHPMPRMILHNGDIFVREEHGKYVKGDVRESLALADDHMPEEESGEEENLDA